jgi:hypothetical protein
MTDDIDPIDMTIDFVPVVLEGFPFLRRTDSRKDR